MKRAQGARRAEHHRAFREYLAGRDVPCPDCRFNLRDNEVPWCPECGRSLCLKDVRRSPRWPWQWRTPDFPVMPMTRGQWVLAIVSIAGALAWLVARARIGELSEDRRGAGLLMMLLGFGIGFLGSQVRKGGLVRGGFSPLPRASGGLAIGWLGVVIGVAGLWLVSG